MRERRGLTFKVWNEDGTETLTESTDMTECLRVARTAWVAGRHVVLEDPDGREWNRTDARKLRRVRE